MKIIVGLGNPGSEYVNTRHNVGFLFLDFLVHSWNFEAFKASKFKALISEGSLNGEKIILVKPMTFMNLSGEAISGIVNFYKIDFKKDLIVVFDDMSMEFSKLRFRSSGSAGGHNGIKSIINCLGNEDFSRIKIGVGLDTKYSVSDWVLSKFKKEELDIIKNDIFPKTLVLLNDYLLS